MKQRLNAPTLRQHPKTLDNKPSFKSGRLIRWENGVPYPVYAPPMQKDQLSSLINAAIAVEYEGELDEETGERHLDPRYEGCTMGEVMALKLAEKAASGNLNAVNMVFDRILGKPKQSVESTTMTVSYTDYLAQLAQEESAEQGIYSGLANPDIIDVDPSDIGDPHNAANRHIIEEQKTEEAQTSETILNSINLTDDELNSISLTDML